MEPSTFLAIFPYAFLAAFPIAGIVIVTKWELDSRRRRQKSKSGELENKSALEQRN